MKKLGLLFMWIVLLVLLGSCLNQESYQIYEHWLCSINADGTGFRKIKKVDSNFGTTGFWDIYMTKDNRIIFYGDKLWISETDEIYPVSMTDNIYILQDKPTRLSQSPDGSKLYFASRDKNIHELNLNTMVSRQLTSESVRTLRNPIVSDLGSYITYTSKGYGEPSKATEYMYWLNLITGESDVIPCPDTVSVNTYYSESEGYVYYEEAGLFRSKLDGSDRSTVDNQGGSSYPYTMFSMSADNRYIAHTYNVTYNRYNIRIFDKTSSNGVNLPVTEVNPYVYLGKMCKEANYMYYVDPQNDGKLCIYNMDTGENRVLIGEGSHYRVIGYGSLAPTWDGSKVYFTASVEY